MKKTSRLCAIYPGSFDPITKGHIDLVSRMQKMFDTLIVLVAHSLKKKYLFSLPERLHLVSLCLNTFPKVEVSSYQGLTVDYMKTHHIPVIIRGIRGASDFEYEYQMAEMNKYLFPDCETFFVFSRPEYNHLSSQVIKEVFFNKEGKESLKKWLPRPVIQALRQKWRQIGETC